MSQPLESQLFSQCGFLGGELARVITCWLAERNKIAVERHAWLQFVRPTALSPDAIRHVGKPRYPHPAASAGNQSLSSISAFFCCWSMREPE
jgi:hypothetical protein